MKRSLSAREKALWGMTAAVALLAAVQMMVVRPLLADMRLARAKVLLGAQEAARLRRAVVSRAEVEKAYAEISDKLKPAGTTESEIIGLLLAAERAAQESGVEIIENEHVRRESGEYFDRHTLRFKGRGTPEQMVGLIHRLESPSSLLKIERMSARMRDHRLEAEFEMARLIGTEALAP